MKHRIAVLAGLLPFAVVAIGPAQAQTVYLAPRVYVAPPPMFSPVVPRREVLAIVRAAGFSPLTQPARRGARYVILASDRAGGQVRIVMHAYSGAILRVRPAYDPRFAYHPARPPAAVPGPRPRYGEAPPPDMREPAPRGTGALPPRGANPRIASAPDVAPVPPRPARTPLPRPRPKLASSDPPPAAAPPAAAPAAPPVETSPEAETIGSAPPPASAPSGRIVPTPRPAVPAKPTETPLVPVAPLD